MNERIEKLMKKEKMAENIKIRLAKEADYEAVNGLYFLEYDLYHQNMPTSYKKIPATVLARGDFLNIIDDKKSLMIVAESDGVVVGHLYGYLDKNEDDTVTYGHKWFELAELSVHPKCARSGVGTALVKEAEQWAKKKRVFEFSTLVYDFNTNAKNFYEAKGFTPYSIKMTKTLKPDKEV